MSWVSKLIRKHKGGRLAKSLGLHQTSEDGLVCFYVPNKSRGWILEAASREIANRLSAPTVFCGDYGSLPAAAAYYFCHYQFYLSAIRIYPWLKQAQCVVWFTHPKTPDLGGPATVEALQHATVITMCEQWRDLLIQRGLPPERVVTIVGAADPQVFLPHTRGNGKVGFCTAYYERKHPDRILEIIRSVPEFPCVLLGRNWEQYPRFRELECLPNFEYRQAAYEEYPAFYSELDVFVSASQLEGGPIPLLESMLSNVVPVASDTGFAPDVITHGRNGFLFSADVPDCQPIVSLIRRAMQLDVDVRSTVLSYSWDEYARQHADLLKAA